jgi:glycine hydroxymethyltransferase
MPPLPDLRVLCLRPIVTTTTHKTLRSGRGGMILTNNEDLFKKINSAVFPGLQGGPLMHVIAGKAAGFGEALSDEFKIYAKNIILNAQCLSSTLIERGYDIVSGGTDNHIVLLSLKDKNITGSNAEIALEKAGLTCNKNGIPFDPLPPTITSGIRFGSAAATTRGFKINEFKLIGNYIADVLDGFNKNSSNEEQEKITYDKVKDLCKKFPIY